MTWLKFKMRDTLIRDSDVLFCDYHCSSSSTPPSSHRITTSFFFFCIFKIYPFGNFYVYIPVLLTLITALFIFSPELIHFITGSLYSLTSIIPPSFQPLLTTILLSKLSPCWLAFCLLDIIGRMNFLNPISTQSTVLFYKV